MLLGGFGKETQLWVVSLPFADPRDVLQATSPMRSTRSQHLASVAGSPAPRTMALGFWSNETWRRHRSWRLHGWSWQVWCWAPVSGCLVPTICHFCHLKSPYRPYSSVLENSNVFDQFFQSFFGSGSDFQILPAPRSDGPSNAWQLPQRLHHFQHLQSFSAWPRDTPRVRRCRPALKNQWWVGTCWHGEYTLKSKEGYTGKVHACKRHRLRTTLWNPLTQTPAVSAVEFSWKRYWNFLTCHLGACHGVS